MPPKAGASSRTPKLGPRDSRPRSNRDAGHLAPVTEASLAASANLDLLPPERIVALLAREDRRMLAAVRKAAPGIVRGAEFCRAALAGGGRICFVGAGTSGRLGAMEAAECPPTFGTRPSQVLSAIAGGRRAFFRAVEGAEDRATDGRAAIRTRRLGRGDCVIGIAASRLTPFTMAAIGEARRRGARTILVTCNPSGRAPAVPPARCPPGADVVIAPIVGPEVLSGSTRLKAATATKLVLNALTLTAMVGCGKVYRNRMVDLRPGSSKLRRRALRIVVEETGLSAAAAQRLFRSAGGHVKTALAMHLLAANRSTARRRLAAAGGRLRSLIPRPPA